ncbi:hypothetical protein EP47_10600 [Legionella norrlandica]|uniref:Lpg0393-like VPS9-like domain-containing protein n=2 Tax=Legionella norrlandica TaxID=1498499 RepID=A0A0A2SPI6_9GAMM|nr:hypothetical protein EP47_10600 [Legionella norrlandica]
MIKREQELLEQIARALTIDENISKEARLDLVFSALFEIDKIQKGQTEQLSKDRLEGVNSETATEVLLKHIAATEKTDHSDIQAVRSILKEMIKEPQLFGLSPKTHSFFLPFAVISIVSKGEGAASETDTVLLQKREWITSKVFSTQDLGAKAENAQVFVDALRQGNYTIASKLARWVSEKYSNEKLNPRNKDLGADNLFPLIAYELAHTDIGAPDMAALMHMYDHTAGDTQYATSLMFSGVQNMFNRLSALQKEYPNEDSLQILARMRIEHRDFLSTNDPIKSLEGGLQFKEEDRVNLTGHYKQNKITAFAEKNRDAITANLIVLNTKEASLEDINTLLAVKVQIIKYINCLETNPPEKPKRTYINRLEAANQMLDILQKGGTIQDDIIPAIKAQANIIANNKPGFKELGFLGWIQSFFDKYKPQISKETSETLEAIDSIVDSKKGELPVEELISHPLFSDNQEDEGTHYVP